MTIEHAQAIGANAIVGVHYNASGIGGETQSTEVVCYGTAVVIR